MFKDFLLRNGIYLLMHCVSFRNFAIFIYYIAFAKHKFKSNFPTLQCLRAFLKKLCKGAFKIGTKVVLKHLELYFYREAKVIIFLSHIYESENFLIRTRINFYGWS